MPAANGVTNLPARRDAQIAAAIFRRRIGTAPEIERHGPRLPGAAQEGIVVDTLEVGQVLVYVPDRIAMIDVEVVAGAVAAGPPFDLVAIRRQMIGDYRQVGEALHFPCAMAQ